jgi:hypothetical protein
MANRLTQDFSENVALATFPTRTPRLKFVRKDRALADSEEAHQLGQALGASVPASWPIPCPGPFGGHEALHWSNYYMVLTDTPEGHALVGIAGAALWDTEDGTLEFGGILAPEYRGAGLAEEIPSIIRDWALSHPQINRVVCDSPTEYPGLVKSLERAGFSKTEEVPGPGFGRFVAMVNESTGP